MNKFESPPSPTVNIADHGPGTHDAPPGDGGIGVHDTGAVIDTIIQTLSGTAHVGSADGVANAAMHDVGNVVAEAAQFHASEPAGSFDPAASDHVPSTEAGLHSATEVHAPDLSDVGAALHTVTSDIALSNFDLDHLTSTVDLFDSGHADSGLDTHHS